MSVIPTTSVQTRVERSPKTSRRRYSNNVPPAKKHLFDRALTRWRERWDDTANGKVTYEFFPCVHTRRFQHDFDLNQVFSGYGTFGDHQTCLFRKNLMCFCETNATTSRHCLYVCYFWWSTRDTYFPDDYQTQTKHNLCLDNYSDKGVKATVSEILLRAKDLNLGRQRNGISTRAQRDRTPQLNTISPARGSVCSGASVRRFGIPSMHLHDMVM